MSLDLLSNGNTLGFLLGKSILLAGEEPVHETLQSVFVEMEQHELDVVFDQLGLNWELSLLLFNLSQDLEQKEGVFIIGVELLVCVVVLLDELEHRSLASERQNTEVLLENLGGSNDRVEFSLIKGVFEH